MPTCSDRSRPEQARDYVLGALSAAEETAFEDHVAGCSECAERVAGQTSALDRLVEDVLIAGQARTEPSRPSFSGARPASWFPEEWSWRTLPRLVLSPAAAIVYLVLLVAVLPTSMLLRSPIAPDDPARGGGGTPEPAAPGVPDSEDGGRRGATGGPDRDRTRPQGVVPRAEPEIQTSPPAVGASGDSGAFEAGQAVRVLPRAIRVFGEETVRGGESGVRSEATTGDASPSPIPLELDPASADGGRFVLDLRTEIADEELRDPGAVFLVQLWEGKRSIWSARTMGKDFERGGGFRLELQAAGLSPRATYVLLIRPELPHGDPSLGAVLFKRTFRLAPQRQSPAVTKPAQR